MLLHSCQRCGFETKIFDDYVNHLWQNNHQMMARSSFMNWSDDENLKSVVVYAPQSPFPSPSNVLDIFLRQSLSVVDFVCWAHQTQNFLIQLSHKEDVDRMLELCRQQSPELAFKGNLLGLRRKIDVQEFEWPGLVGQTASSSVNHHVLVELSDDDDNIDNSKATKKYEEKNLNV